MKLVQNLGLRQSNSLRDGKYRNFSWGLYECPLCLCLFEYQNGRMKKSAPKSCGCLLPEKHGDYKTSLYGVWKAMRQRCRLTSSTAYKYYGAKGIDVCDEWYNSYLCFKAWSTSSGYNEELSIDRIDVTKGYMPSNCRWTTKTVQSRNTTKLRSTNTSGFRGVSWSKRDNTWLATISVNYKSINLGSYKSALEAAKAYDTYVITNNFEHTINGVLYEPIRSQ